MSLSKLAIFPTERRVLLDCLEESIEEQTNAISTVENVSTHMVGIDTGTTSNQVVSNELGNNAVNMVTKQVVSVEQHDFAVGSENVPSTKPVQANVTSIENVLPIADDNTLNFQS